MGTPFNWAGLKETKPDSYAMTNANMPEGKSLGQNYEGHAVAIDDPIAAEAGVKLAGGGLSAGPKGIGGSDTEASTDRSVANAALRRQPSPQATREYTPDELMAFADAHTQDFMNRTHAAEAPNASLVQSTLDRDNGAPSWLHAYMEKQSAEPSKIDMVSNGEHKHNRQLLALVKQLEQKHGLR